jgi:hypothetical protein
VSHTRVIVSEKTGVVLDTVQHIRGAFQELRIKEKNLS